jgi:UPF0271 protein
VRIDLNCDMGESFGPWKIGADEQVMPHITSANIACGAHAGDPVVMRHTVRLARAAGVAIGAHPGFADLQGFGRREMTIPHAELEASLIAQIGALAAIARAEGGALQHVKPHGALYNMAARDRALSDAIARAIAAIDRSLILFGLPNSPMLEAGRAAGLRVAAEGFADRAYQPDAVVARAVRMATDGVVLTGAGAEVSLNVNTICVHGDTPGASELVRRIHEALRERRVEIAPIGEWL